MITNKYGIKTIQISSKAKCYCPLGKDWYTNNFTIFFQVGEIIPDYCEMDKFIDDNRRSCMYFI